MTEGFSEERGRLAQRDLDKLFHGRRKTLKKERVEAAQENFRESLWKSV
jgi:hypothetical protein